MFVFNVSFQICLVTHMITKVTDNSWMFFFPVVSKYWIVFKRNVTLKTGIYFRWIATCFEIFQYFFLSKFLATFLTSDKTRSMPTTIFVSLQVGVKLERFFASITLERSVRTHPAWYPYSDKTVELHSVFLLKVWT